MTLPYTELLDSQHYQKAHYSLLTNYWATVRETGLQAHSHDFLLSTRAMLRAQSAYYSYYGEGYTPLPPNCPLGDSYILALVQLQPAVAFKTQEKLIIAISGRSSTL